MPRSPSCSAAAPVMTRPLMLVELPTGSSAVRVEVEGQPIDQTVVIAPRDGRELYLYWD